ncbi:MAG: RbsD/FucU family protein, partial [Pannonibacter indicus]
MLKGIHPLISPELLMVLAAMGHGDEIAIVDANFPAESTARHTVHGVPLRMDCPAVKAVEAILTLLPVDTFDGDPVFTMQVVGDAAAIPPVVAEAVALPAGAEVVSAQLSEGAINVTYVLDGVTTLALFDQTT